MGCKESTERTEDDVNPAHKPKVPLESWYGLDFDEPATMPFTRLHRDKRGRVVFSHKQVPTRQAELDALGTDLQLRETFILGKDAVYALGFLHESALNIEHCWRLRVAHGSVNGMQRFDRPFFDMLLGVKVYINDILVPDTCAHGESMPQCTTTYRAHEGTTQWRAVPVVLWPEPDSSFNEGTVYPPLMYSFLSAASTLEPGFHDVRVEIVYGCKSEGEFCTDFISRGECKVEMSVEAQTMALNTLTMIEAVAKNSNPQPFRPLVNNRDDKTFSLCTGCSRAQKYVCNVCGATVCGSTTCVFSDVEGYPVGCHIHPAQDQ